MDLLSTTILLFLVMDPFGNAPFFLCILKGIPTDRRLKILVRELFIALVIMVFFLYTGSHLLHALHISDIALQLSGGIILFLIAIKMIFGRAEEIFSNKPGGEPLIVPLATPSIAGPSIIAVLLVQTAQYPDQMSTILFALLIAWFSTSVLLLMSTKLGELLGERGLSAMQSLMGLILTAIAVDMFIDGLEILLY